MLKRLLTCLVLLGTAACGTTVPGIATQQGLSPGPGTAVAASSVPAPGTTAAGSTSAAGNLLAHGSGTGGTSGGSSTTPGRAGGDGLTARPGAPVEVGFEYATGVTAFASALGISADVGDGKQQANAILAWVNAHGGLGGHPVKPVYYALDLTRTDPYSQFMDEMCSLWTQDHHVVAAFAYANADFSPVASCLTQHHAIFSSYAAYSRDQADFAHNANWVETSTLSSERLAQLQVQSFEHQGFFKDQTKAGLLAYDYPQAQRLTELIVAKLKQRGITTVVYRVHYGGSTPELAGTISSIQSAVLRFQSERIQRVLSAAYPGAIAFFMRYADNQSYKPRYGLSSYDALGSLPDNAPVGQLHGAIAAGWWPTADQASGDRPPLNASGKVCRSAFSKAGIPASQDAYSFGYCDEALSLHAAAGLVSGALTGDALRVAFEQLRSAFASPSMLGTTFAARRHDGVSRARSLAFNDTCSCWRSGGSAYPIP